MRTLLSGYPAKIILVSPLPNLAHNFAPLRDKIPDISLSRFLDIFDHKSVWKPGHPEKALVGNFISRSSQSSQSFTAEYMRFSLWTLCRRVAVRTLLPGYPAKITLVSPLPNLAHNFAPLRENIFDLVITAD